MNMDFTRCEICNHIYVRDVLIDGWVCERCLRTHLNEDRFFKFATSDTPSADAADRLEDFFFTKIFRIKSPSSGSVELRAYLKDLYKRSIAEDLLLERRSFRQQIIDYVMGNYATTEAYAHWLRGYLEELKEKTKVRGGL